MIVWLDAQITAQFIQNVARPLEILVATYTSLQIFACRAKVTIAAQITKPILTHTVIALITYLDLHFSFLLDITRLYNDSTTLVFL